MLLPKPKHFAWYVAFFVAWSLARTSPVVAVMDNWIYGIAQTLSYSVAWLKFWYWVTQIGKGWFVSTVLIYFGVVYMNQARSVRAIFFIGVFILFFNTGTLLKIFFELPRPVALASFYAGPTSYTYPSGHAFNAVMLFFFVPQFFLRVVLPNLHLPPDWRWPFSRVLCFVGIVLICLSRVFLGVHWLSDVVGGALWGAFVAHLALWFFDRKMIHEIHGRYLRS